MYNKEGSLTYILGFEKSKNPCFLITIFNGLFFKIFTLLKVWDNILIATFILNLLLKTIWFYLLNVLRDNVSCKPLFLP